MPKSAVISQYEATLHMMRQVIEACPDERWIADEGYAPCWHIAYHALFYTHLYLQPSEADFSPWPRHREHYEMMGPTPWPPHEKPEISVPYTRAELLEYVDYCITMVEPVVDALDFTATESGFSWIPMGKLELQFYNIRHLQQHIGELCARLDRAGVSVAWVGLAPA